MKKILSFILVFVFLLGTFCTFPVSFAAEVDTPYSGGSGTEDDPYLISNRKDLGEIAKNIESDPMLWGTKVYYKLTNDITIGHSGDFVSPVELYADIDSSEIQFEYDTEKIVYEYDSYWLQDMPQEYIGEDEYTEIFEETISKVGPLTYWYSIALVDTLWYPYRVVESDHYTDTLDDLLEYVKYKDHYDKLFLVGEAAYWSISKSPEFTREKVFSGVFDGDGHTITYYGASNNGNNYYIFGHLKNGAEIKNINFDGTYFSLAYSVGEGCKISNCTFASREYNGYSVINQNYGTVEHCTFLSDMPEKYPFVKENYGTVEQCVIFGDAANGIVAGGDHNAINCVDISGTMDGSLENIYTEEECISANGDASVYEGFDFENDWVMLGGMPYLRSFCKAVAGDLNLDGTIDSIDTNLLKRLVVGANPQKEYSTYAGADVNLDGEINAVDSALLRRMLVGEG